MRIRASDRPKPEPLNLNPGLKAQSRILSHTLFARKAAVKKRSREIDEDPYRGFKIVIFAKHQWPGRRFGDRNDIAYLRKTSRHDKTTLSR
jgi:hypothetical protein